MESLELAEVQRQPHALLSEATWASATQYRPQAQLIASPPPAHGTQMLRPDGASSHPPPEAGTSLDARKGRTSVH